MSPDASVEEARGRARRALATLVDAHGADLPLDEAAAWLAVEERPELDAHHLLDRLDALAKGIHLREGAPVHEVVARLNHHLFTEHGFAGDLEHYDAPHNSLLDQVLQRRRGLPILLSLVYLEVARRAGATFQGIGFPGHFLVAPADASPRFFVDPFHGGRILREDQLEARLQQMMTGAPAPAGAVTHAPTLAQVTAPVSGRYVMVRINNNLKGAWLRKGDVAGALRAVERLLLLQPALLEERRDCGLMLAHLGRLGEAVVELRTYLDLWPGAPDREQVEARIEVLEAALER